MEWIWHLIDSVLSLGIVGIAYAVLRFTTKKLVNKIVDNRFDRNLQKHAHELNLQMETYKTELTFITEQRKFDLQRKSQDFVLYTNKRHTVYPELFKFALIAEKEVKGNKNVYEMKPIFDSYSESDMEIYMEQNEVLSSKREEILALYTTNKHEAINKVLNHIQNINRKKTWKALNDYLYFVTCNELYLSNEVADSSQEIYNKLRELLQRKENISNSNESIQRRTELEDDSRLCIMSLKDLMKKELSIAYYQ